MVLRRHDTLTHTHETLGNAPGRTLALSLLEYDSVQVQLSFLGLYLQNIADGLEASQACLFLLSGISPDLELNLIDLRRSIETPLTERRLVALLLPRTPEVVSLRKVSRMRSASVSVQKMTKCLEEDLVCRDR